MKHSWFKEIREPDISMKTYHHPRMTIARNPTKHTDSISGDSKGKKLHDLKSGLMVDGFKGTGGFSSDSGDDHRSK